MLVEFNVTNFRSLRETQTLSLVAGPGHEHEGTNCFASGAKAVPRLLRSAVIYGPNAGGKTNLMRAIHFMQLMVVTSATLVREGEQLAIAPFAFDPKSATEPSLFEATFVADGVRYQFGFAATKHRVTHEWLFAFPKNKKQHWYERIYDPKTEKERWEWGPSFTGRKEVWRDATRGNALFLSTAIQLNNEQLRPVFNWFGTKLAIHLPHALLDPQWTLRHCASSDGKSRVLKFMNAADLSIDDIAIETKKGQQVAVTVDSAKGIQTLIGPPQDIQVVKFRHKVHHSNNGSLLDAGDESTGTQKLFALAGAWLDVMEKGHVLFVDELDNSLHPHIARFLIGLFHRPDINKGNAQLVVATHDTSLLDGDLYRRDQVWFIEKDKENASYLYPLTDFSPRREEALEKGYLRGRYGALPFLGELRV